MSVKSVPSELVFSQIFKIVNKTENTIIKPFFAASFTLRRNKLARLSLYTLTP
jgi:hypothetical protein